MDWGQVLAATLFNTVFTAGALAALAFLGRSIVQRWIDKDLENYKAKLEAANAAELERLRADLRIAIHERETTFAKLHEKRAEVIAELYRRLVQAETAYRRILISRELPLDSEQNVDLLDAIKNSVENFDYNNKNRLYFPNEVLESIEALDDEFRYLANQLILHKHTLQQDEDSFYTESLIKAYDTIYGSLPGFRQRVETEFRRMLGEQAE